MYAHSHCTHKHMHIHMIPAGTHTHTNTYIHTYIKERAHREKKDDQRLRAKAQSAFDGPIKRLFSEEEEVAMVQEKTR